MWLLDAKTREILENVYNSGYSIDAQAALEFEAAAVAVSDFRVVDGVAQIPIRGVLTKRPDLIAQLFGGGNTTYSAIASALVSAESDSDVRSIDLEIDSPGGSIDGLFETLNTIVDISKPVRAIVSDMAASAAYAIAAQADSIVATNVAARFGSVGVVATIGVSDSRVTIASTEAPQKRPDVTTEEGRGMVRNELDATHDIFARAIATGRGTTVDAVNQRYGRGATVLAAAALERGMIDAVERLEINNSSITVETTAMNVEQLKTQHMETYAMAVKAGVDQERDRVLAHITMGEASGDLKTAFAAVREGSDMTATLQATYLAAGMNKSDVRNRESDNVDVDAGDTAQVDAFDAVMEIVEANAGVEGGR